MTFRDAELISDGARLHTVGEALAAPLPVAGGNARVSPDEWRRLGRQRQRVWAITMVVALVVGGALGAVAILAGVDLGPPVGPLPMAITFGISFYLVFYVQCVGYAIGRRLFGLRVPKRTRTRRRRWRRRARGAPYLPILLIAQCSGAVSPDEPGLARRLASMIVAGFLADLLLSAGTLGLLLGGWSRWFSTGVATVFGIPLAALLAWTGFLSGAVAVTLLIPRRIYGALATPGETVRLLMRGGPPAARLLALGRLMAVDAPSRQPRDWDPVLLKRALMLPDQSYEDALASMFGYYVALDRDDILAAGDLLQRALAAAGRVSPRWRASFALEAAFFYAHHQKDATTARRWMKLEETRFKGTTLLARAETALLLAEGRPEIARMRARQALWKHQRGGLPTTADVVWLQEIVDQTGNAGDPSASP